MMLAAMSDELLKIAEEEITAQEAVQAMKRLRKLEREKPTGGQLARGALTGALVGPAAATASKLVGGGMGEAARKAMSKSKHPVGKALALGSAAVRGLAAPAASGAVFGAGLPIVRGELERGSEKAKLREYLGVARGGKVRRKAKRVLGV